jgi:hypothetical protein
MNTAAPSRALSSSIRFQIDKSRPSRRAPGVGFGTSELADYYGRHNPAQAP